jgi:tripartite-type tricarboxylate transporter receptor subunit TctC
VVLALVDILIVQSTRRASIVMGLAAALLAGAPPAAADEVADFYKGKNVSLFVGYPPGGGYDVYARLVAR